MKFATIRNKEEYFVGLVCKEDSSVIPLRKIEKMIYDNSFIPKTMIECIEMGESFVNRTKEIENWLCENDRNDLLLSLNDVNILAPISRPRKNIFCIGKNYVEHALEIGSKDDIPEHIMVFTKAPTAVIGQNESILPHKEVTSQLDYEGELAVIIGKKGKQIKKDNAHEYIFGYTIINDVTARDLQSRHKQFFMGKSLDTTCPMGPWIVHKSEIDNPNQLQIQTKVNGEIRQNSNTEKFIFPIEEIISVLSMGMTLEPGDIIATGTPAGVGKGFKPPRFLKSGDDIEIMIEKIGTLRNQIG